MGTHVHKLLNVDTEARTAECAHCGPVGIVSGGFYRGVKQWRCKTAKRASDKTEHRREYMATYAKDYYERTGGVAQRKAWLKQYGLTPEDFDRLLAEQNGKCAICGEGCSTGQNLSVDHCHTAGHVRGLLCRNCNRGLGLFGDDPERLAKAAAYLRS